MCKKAYKGIKGLQTMFEKFEKRRSVELKDRSNLTEDQLVKRISKVFCETCAEKILRGYFIVNGKYILDVKAIELYYHEENDSIKDHIMYHTGEHYKKDSRRFCKDELPYFEFGTLNLHQSGVDITFENPKEHYRASFLIREYRMLKNEEDLLKEDTKYDIHSTHLFDDIFYLGIPVTEPLDIEWHEYEGFKNKKIISKSRVNVAQYRPSVKDSSKFEKDDSIPAGADINNKDLYIKAGKGKVYKQCQRPWRFIREPFKDSIK